MLHAVEPGARLVDRYRLEDHLGDRDGASYWRALDELLDRPVGVCLLEAGAERAAATLSAAQRAATVSDPRFLRVLDANEADGVVYVVSEWVVARSLAAMLDNGPLPPAEAARSLVADVAEAMASAHQQGLAHLCLQPDHVLRTTHGQLKVAGLAVDAAVRGVRSIRPEDDARRDAYCCGTLLYAALTARWPGHEATGLPDAPYDAGELCSPRQVRAGVPVDLDHIAVRALGETRVGGHSRTSGGPITTPGELAQSLALAHVANRMPTDTPPEGTPRLPEQPGGEPTYDGEDDRGRHLLTRAAWVLTVLVLLVGLALAAWQLMVVAFDDSEQSTPQPSRSGGASAPRGETRVLPVAAVQAFDPPPDGNGEENDSDAAAAADGDLGTSWSTMTYFDPFGPAGIKDGVGLTLDLGRQRSLSRVTVAMSGAGANMQLRVAESPGATSGDYRLVAQAFDESAEAVLKPDRPVQARYLLVWLTSLPSDGSNYRGTISEIEVRGS